MLEERFFTAGKALKLIFIGQVIALFVSLPNVGNLISLIAGITILVGIVRFCLWRQFTFPACMPMEISARLKPL